MGKSQKQKKYGEKFEILTLEKKLENHHGLEKGDGCEMPDSYGELTGIKYKIGVERKKTILENHRCKWKEVLRI